MTLRFRLFLCLCLLGLSLLVLALFSYNSVQSMAERTRSIVVDRVVPMDQLKTVSDQYAIEIVNTAHKVRASTITWEDGGKKVQAAKDIIDATWNQYAATMLTPEEKELVAKFEAAHEASAPVIAELQTILANTDQMAIGDFIAKKLYPAIDPVTDTLNQLMDLQLKVAQEDYKSAEAVHQQLVMWMAILSGGALLILGFSLYVVQGNVVRPLAHLQLAMRKLAEGDLTARIFGEGRRDEIGAMASAVAVFRDNALERHRLEAEAREGQARRDAEKARLDAEKERENAAVRDAVAAIGAGLGELSNGNLAHRITEPLASHLDSLRSDFNASVATLQMTLGSIGQNARAIDGGANEIRNAADDLSRRTEKQAASVEETAAALEQIATTVKESTKRAEDVGSLVNHARTAVQNSGTVVMRAIGAMQEIEKSSSQISSIIGVIDEIAFQTNLLALNAGVEAARAGEAGRGFAVVAQEVRELAQRSANAAKEIKTLITTSTTQVKTGVSLVGETGKALEEIAEEVIEITRHVTSIIEAAREQAAGISEINAAVTSIDHGTQQNAAMVEESTAASRSLASEAAALTALLAQFHLGEASSAGSVRRAA